MVSKKKIIDNDYKPIEEELLVRPFSRALAKSL
jgi:hypothetical protein